ncbi:alanine:cation symporter family protein [Clostridioides sp. ZZV14-6345]|uniref:alanine:cation symporter family protein n=1 Tax=unclassified Clostridioides TaxID=2635829 RepID=UPI002107F7E8
MHNTTRCRAGSTILINTLHPQLGDIFIAIVLLLFTFTTLLAFSYMMETNVSYLVTRIKAEKHEST